MPKVSAYKSKSQAIEENTKGDFPKKDGYAEKQVDWVENRAHFTYKVQKEEKNKNLENFFPPNPTFITVVVEGYERTGEEVCWN